MKNQKAFTLVEILIVVFIMAIIFSIIAGSLVTGNRIATINDDVSEIQQNIRIVTQIMSQELRLAGYELAPHWSAMAVRTTNQIIGNNSSITFYYVADNAQIDVDGDGIADTNQTVQVTYALNGSNIDRTSVTTQYNQATQTFTPIGNPVTNTIATNIDQLRFMYFWGDDVNPGSWNNTPANQSSPGVLNPVITRAVEVSLVARSNRTDSKLSPVPVPYTAQYSGTQVFLSPADQFRRRLASTVVNLRNMK